MKSTIQYINLNKQLNEYDNLYKLMLVSVNVWFINVPCFSMCVLFYFSCVCLQVRAYAFKSKVHCGSTSARRFRASLLLHTTCDHSCCSWSASCVAAKIKQKNGGPP